MSNRKLTIEQRLYLGNLISKGEATAPTLEEEFNIFEQAGREGETGQNILLASRKSSYIR